MADKQDIQRGSNILFYVLLLKLLRKRDLMRGLSGMLSISRNEFHKLNNTGARTLDSIYHMTLKKRFWFEIVNIFAIVSLTYRTPPMA